MPINQGFTDFPCIVKFLTFVAAKRMPESPGMYGL